MKSNQLKPTTAKDYEKSLEKLSDEEKKQISDGDYFESEEHQKGCEDADAYWDTINNK